jgi:acetate kinase
VALNTINLTLFTGGVYGDNQLCATDKLYQIKLYQVHIDMNKNRTH